MHLACSLYVGMCVKVKTPGCRFRSVLTTDAHELLTIGLRSGNIIEYLAINSYNFYVMNRVGSTQTLVGLDNNVTMFNGRYSQNILFLYK